MGEFPHFPGRRDTSHPLAWPVSGPCLWPRSGMRARVGGVSGAVAADRPGPRSEPPGTAELLCALSFGSGLAAAERMEHGTNTAFVGVQLGHALGAGAGDLEAVFYGALVKDAGCGACGAVLARYFADDEMVPRLDLNLVDLHSPRNMAAWTMSQLHLDAGLPARLARLAAFASRCGPVVHEATAVHCEVAADFAAGLGFGHHVQDAVHYQYERHDGRSPAFGRRAEAIPRAAQILHLALAADLVRGLSGAEAAAAMVSQRTGPTSIRTWPGPTSTWPAACGQTAMSRSRSPTCCPVPPGPRSTSCPATGAWPCARRWPTSPTSSPRGAAPTRT